MSRCLTPNDVDNNNNYCSTNLQAQLKIDKNDNNKQNTAYDNKVGYLVVSESND